MGSGFHRTVLMEMAERCGTTTIVMPRGCDYSVTEAEIECIAVGPHDYELMLRHVNRPILYIDTRRIPPSSPWFGVFGPDDMRLNLCMAGLIETVKLKGGQVAFTRPLDGMEAPLVADFAMESEEIEDWTALLHTVTQM
jgi:hypothetical protein